MTASRQNGERARLLLFAKVPAPGRVKTRLCPPLSPEGAARLYGAFLCDVVRASMRSPAYEPCVYAWPEGELGQLELPAELPLRAQRGEDLAARMLAAIEECQREAPGPVVLRNTDSPELEAARVDEAFAALAGGADLVLAPDEGGGYYLIGVRAETPALADVLGAMRAVPAGEVFAATIARARAAGLAIFVLPRAPDVDVPEDLARLRARLREDPERAAETARVLEEEQ